MRRNAATYVEQASLLLDVARAEIRFNSEWMDELSSQDFVRLCSHYTSYRVHFLGVLPITLDRLPADFVLSSQTLCSHTFLRVILSPRFCPVSCGLLQVVLLPQVVFSLLGCEVPPA